jgi:hypothetical protein
LLLIDETINAYLKYLTFEFDIHASGLPRDNVLATAFVRYIPFQCANIFSEQVRSGKNVHNHIIVHPLAGDTICMKDPAKKIF